MKHFISTLVSLLVLLGLFRLVASLGDGVPRLLAYLVLAPVFFGMQWLCGWAPLAKRHKPVAVALALATWVGGMWVAHPDARFPIGIVLAVLFVPTLALAAMVDQGASLPPMKVHPDDPARTPRRCLEKLTLSTMASGNQWLLLTERVGWEGFPMYAEWVAAALDLKVDSRGWTVVDHLWEVEAGGHSYLLVFDDFPFGVTLEARDKAASDHLPSLREALSGLRAEHLEAARDA